MADNSTQNIYSSEYNDSGRPIPADIIGYDNETSGMTATNAQEAIDELAEGLGTLSETVSEIVEMPALPADSADGTYILKATANAGTITYEWVAEV